MWGGHSCPPPLIAGCQPRQEVSAYLTGAVEVTFNLHYPPERTARPKPARNDHRR